jgi:predicted nucleic acid-binding protein
MGRSSVCLRDDLSPDVGFAQAGHADHHPVQPRIALIAAMALVHGMAVVCRNTADFAASGVRVINPWTA